MGSLYIYSIEIVQRRAACWVKSDCNYNSSVSTMLRMAFFATSLIYNKTETIFVLPPVTTTLSTSKFLSLEQMISNLATTPVLFVIGITYLSYQSLDSF